MITCAVTLSPLPLFSALRTWLVLGLGFSVAVRFRRVRVRVRVRGRGRVRAAHDGGGGGGGVAPVLEHQVDGLVRVGVEVRGWG